MVAAGNTSFYKVERVNGCIMTYRPNHIKSISGRENFIILENKSEGVVWKNPGAKIIDLGDGYLISPAHQELHPRQ